VNFFSLFSNNLSGVRAQRRTSMLDQGARVSLVLAKLYESDQPRQRGFFRAQRDYVPTKTRPTLPKSSANIFSARVRTVATRPATRSGLIFLLCDLRKWILFSEAGKRPSRIKRAHTKRFFDHPPLAVDGAFANSECATQVRCRYL
jgi:hypothetical protein